jgi:hypothetical protein
MALGFDNMPSGARSRMHKWQCIRCGEYVSTTFERNLGALIQDHKQNCKQGDLSEYDIEFLDALKVRW